MESLPNYDAYKTTPEEEPEDALLPRGRSQVKRLSDKFIAFEVAANRLEEALEELSAAGIRRLEYTAPIIQARNSIRHRMRELEQELEDRLNGGGGR